jgi:hypothetical protein
MGLSVLELVKTKNNATTATLVVSTHDFTHGVQQFLSGTGFALNRLSVCFSKPTPQRIATDGHR